MCKKILFVLLLTLSLGLFSCKAAAKKNLEVAVFIPGICADSPVYAMLRDGVLEGIDDYNSGKADEKKAHVYILEAGTNQSEWPAKITALAAEQKYDVIISSNPSLPEIVTPIIEQFPEQKFILLDAECSGNKNICTICYNQYEQAYLTGYIGGLMSKSNKLGLIAAQEYPVMNNIIYPYFEKGAKDAVPASTVDFQIVGNWYDANKGAMLTDILYDKGVDVILPICGGASQGVINSAVDHGIYITWFDNNGFDKAPGTIISSTVMLQRELSAIVTKDFLNGKTEWGTAKMLGIKDGFVDFVQDDENYISTVPANIRSKMADLVSSIKEGKTTIQ
ncbi:MAG: BMP family ABC transporter substrate-binding protein [Treponema sp.]|nr:BMP family ABC transporter substrate-binding protein [Treponema sp.]